MQLLSLLCICAIVAALQVPGTSAFFWDTFFGSSSSSSSSEEEVQQSNQKLGGSANARTTPEQNEIVNKHNELRRRVKPAASNMLQMKWNSEAAANAQQWVSKCTMNHSPEYSRKISTSGCGENIYRGSVKVSWSSVIQKWYNEVKDWDYEKGAINNNDVGHYTQVVWYNSHQVGCAMAHCPKSKHAYHYVCQYCPAGNKKFTRPYSKGSPCGQCRNACNNRLCTNPCPYSDQYDNCPSLKKQSNCRGKVGSWCPASCKCTNEII